jgi:prepilin-type N-terminal cleavage/methylation domain-containing protein
MTLSSIGQLGRRALRLRSARPDRSGFSLIEIMMVMVILTIGVLPIAIIQHRARREVIEADWHTQAISVAQMQMERIKSQGFGNIVAENGVTGNVTWASQVNNVGFGLDRLTVTATWRNNAAIETLAVSDLVSMR